MIRGSVMSDLHLEFHALGDLSGGDILILSGDIWTVAPMRERAQDADSRKLRKRYTKFCVEELSKYKIIFLVLGNHEYYHGIFEDTPNILREFLAKHVPHAIVLDNEFHDWEGVRFIGSTLWATYGYNGINHVAIQRGMNDFTCIRTHIRLEDYDFPLPSRGRTLIVRDLWYEHFKARVFLHDALEWKGLEKKLRGLPVSYEGGRNELPSVVITHHAPSWLCDKEGGILTEGYASNQHDLILREKPVMWTHGHTHESGRVTVGNTLIVSNQRGIFGCERSANFFDPTAADFTLEDVKERKMFFNGDETWNPSNQKDQPF
jgi:Icc-related predicted phosphoesterase